jgi:hypothetical protein
VGERDFGGIFSGTVGLPYSEKKPEIYSMKPWNIHHKQVPKK